jgi:hypothetical protein
MREVPDTPLALSEVCAEARAALDDRSGRLFCKRYFGSVLSPWQAETWETLEDLWDTPDPEYLVENVAPGLGKSTVLVMFAAKRTVMDRSVKGLFISRAQSLAERNVRRLKRALERTKPAPGAEATLSGDFGRFKPRQGGDVWRGDEIVVEQHGGGPIDEKEPTWSAFGFDSEWIGNRLDIVLGDDLDTTKSIRNLEVVEYRRQIFDDELEARLDAPHRLKGADGEPVGGLFVVCQQRLGAHDFSGYCLSKRIVPDDDGVDEDEPEGERQYRHVVYKAHTEIHPVTGRRLCRGRDTHRHDAPAFPDGCLLDPRRMPWKKVRTAMNNRRRFEVVYQQGDQNPDDVLVKMVWIDGGVDPDEPGWVAPGCWDHDRDLCELPAGLPGPKFSSAYIDPSGANYWALQWWIDTPDAFDQQWLMDIERKKMTAGELLDWDPIAQQHTGLMEEWQARSVRLGWKITDWVVEINAAQRYLLQYEHVRTWQRKWGVKIHAHTTGQQKADGDRGPWSMQSDFQHGRIRLPGKNNHGFIARMHSMFLVREAAYWPGTGTTDDEVMCAWFHKLWRPIICRRRESVPQQLPDRPSWLRGDGRHGRRPMRREFVR